MNQGTSISNTIRDLVNYAVEKGLAEETDRVYLTNRILGELDLPAY